MNRQIWVLLAILACVLGFIIWAMLAGRGGGSFVSGGRFRARPGTMRDIVQPRVSSAQEPPDPSSSSDTSATDESDTTIRIQRAMLEKTIRDATTHPDPEEGLRRINEYLNAPHDPAEDSALHSAAAKVRLQLVPADLDGAERSAEAAMASAKTPEDRHRAGYAMASVLRSRGRNEEALKRIETVLESDPETTAPGLELRILQGILYEQGDNAAGAESAYRNVVEHALEIKTTSREETLELYRMAAFRLARLYRESGRAADAEALVQQVTAANRAALQGAP